MNSRIFLALGVSALIGHGSAFAASRDKRRTPAIRSSMTSVAPEKRAQPAPGVAEDVDAEQVRYEEVKAKAKQDPDVVALKTKADRATSDQDARRTSVDYNRMLFRKMRRMDDSVTERADLVEAAILKRINQ